MPDLLFVVITVAFFALAAGFVSVCDRIIGPDSDHGDPVGAGEPDPDELTRLTAASATAGVQAAADAAPTAASTPFAGGATGSATR